jgi:hypothetical protein
MSKPVTPGWPEAGAFPFMPFPVPGTTSPQTSGMDLIKDFWGRLPGGGALPGFMVPTVDVAELDKRIGDLKAAEQWVEVNLNMLRATIQGLEVQRHTIAAIQALTTPAAPPDSGSPATGLPAGWPAPAATENGMSAAGAPTSNDWLAYLQDQFAKVAQAAMPPASAVPAARRKVAKKTAPAKKMPKPR